MGTEGMLQTIKWKSTRGITKDLKSLKRLFVGAKT
jgi:hypothetical protein